MRETDAPVLRDFKFLSSGRHGDGERSEHETSDILASIRELLILTPLRDKYFLL